MLSPEKYNKVKIGFDIYLGLIGIVCLISIILQIGLYLSIGNLSVFWWIIDFFSLTFVLLEILRWVIHPLFRTFFKERITEHLFSLFLLLQYLYRNDIINLASNQFPELTHIDISTFYLIIIETSFLIVLIFKGLRYNYLLSRIKLHPAAMVAISFAAIILTGALMLMLPKATPGHGSLPFVDALFTSTSALCVTGLTVVDTQKDFTLFGQIIIVGLIQIGGLGIMTLTTFFTVFVAGGLSFKARVIMKDILSQNSITEVRSLLFNIALYTVLIELTGALLLYTSLGSSLININWHHLFSSIFHAVSAFCNAGFSIYSLNLMDGLVQSNYFFLSVIMLLIVFGGLGFPVLANIFNVRRMKKKSGKKLMAYSKIVIVTTVILIVFGTMMFLIFEPFNFENNFSYFDKVFHALFLSVTPRTAGFNSVPTESLAFTTTMIIIFLMWVGASPGSTGGGIKTTTFTLALSSFINHIRGYAKTNLFRRKVTTDNINRANFVIFASLIILFIGSLLLISVEPDKDPLNLIFEVTSALGTVGLSRAVSPNLGDGGKIIVTIIMYIGRIGVLTFFLAFYRQSREPKYSLPIAEIPVG